VQTFTSRSFHDGLQAPFRQIVPQARRIASGRLATKGSMNSATHSKYLATSSFQALEQLQVIRPVFIGESASDFAPRNQLSIFVRPENKR